MRCLLADDAKEEDEERAQTRGKEAEGGGEGLTHTSASLLSRKQQQSLCVTVARRM